MSKSDYRRDIDGLRAVAVSLVLLFHLGVAFPGGFIGVDVFFVISGFLITRIIKKSVSKGTLDVREFWRRRILRIFPASAVMVLATLGASYLLMLPDGLKAAADSVIWQQFLVSNHYFWGESGYFRRSSEFLPLLHTWSLSVEEQFYLVYPLALGFMMSRSRRWAGWALLAVATVSFSFSVYASIYHSSVAFYFMPSRIWELAIGGGINFIPPVAIKRRWVREIISGLAITGLFWCAFAYSAETTFPGVAALIPCLGSAILIAVHRDAETVVSRWLSSRALVGIGLVSYSLYLWHWPVISIYKNAVGSRFELEEVEVVALLAGSLILAALSYRFVEQPFRKFPAGQGLLRPLLSATACSAVLASSALLVSYFDGFPARLPERGRVFLAAKNSRSFIEEVTLAEALTGVFPSVAGTKEGVSCLLWGDSHAMALAPGVAAACDVHGTQMFMATHSSTAPIKNYRSPGKYSLGGDSPAFNEAVLSFVREESCRYVIIAGVWGAYAEDSHFAANLRQTLFEITSCGCRVAMVLDVPSYDYDLPDACALAVMRGERLPAKVSGPEYELKQGYANRLIAEICSEFQAASVIDPGVLLRDEQGGWNYLAGDSLLYRDNSHLSTEGGEFLEPLFLQFLSNK